MSHEKTFRFSIRLTVVSVFVLATLITVAVAIGLQYYFSRNMAIESALARYRLTAAGTGDYLSSVDSKASQIGQILARFPALVSDNQVNPDAPSLFAEIMRENPILYAIYIGFPNGNFYELVNLDTDPIVRKQFNALPDDRWIIISVSNHKDRRWRRLDYLTDDLNIRISRRESSDYDPRHRLWYKQAGKDKAFKSKPYLFQHLQAPGQTYSISIPGSGSVLAVDIALSSLSRYLQEQPISREGEIYIYQNSGEIIAGNRMAISESENLNLPMLPLTPQQKQYMASLGTIRISNELDWPPIDYAVAGEPKGFAIDLIRLLARMTGLKFEFVNGFSWAELLELFKNNELEMLQSVMPTADNERLGILSKPFLNLPQALVTREGVDEISELSSLNGKILAIPSGWSSINVIKEKFPEIRILETASTRHALEAVLSGKAYATFDSALILHYTAKRYFLNNLYFHENIDTGLLNLPEELHLLLTPRFDELADILDQALSAIPEEQIDALKTKWFGSNDSTENINTLSVIPYPQLLEIPQQDQAFRKLHKVAFNSREHFIFLSRLHGNDKNGELFAAVIPSDQLLADSMNKVKTSLLLTGLCLMLLLPVSWLFAAPIVGPIKRLALENEKIKSRKYSQVQLTDSNISEIHDLAVSIVEMAKAIKQHEQEQKDLLESFISGLAQAIDAKSPYTAKHCARVPELALMLVNAAEASGEGVFKNFHFDSEDERSEYRMAAWLHDCGKITMPEHIVDKATKLEVIYNRIHEIRTRFEVLWRDAEIEYLKSLATQSEQAYVLKTNLEIRRKQLFDDFEFIARTNIGGEYLDSQDLSRLEKISKQTWTRHFDNRLGLSTEELQRYPPNTVPLPATEQLIDDKPEHIIERFRDFEHDSKYGINMEIPEHLYKQGELYNLSISRGTLTTEDRFKINEHMISTIKMLESLPFPKELARVPRYASTHHETLDGTGYPRKLSAEDLSIPERILAVADIFEALTAADRPYKPAKSLSSSLEIMVDLVNNNHIDSDVFELFLRSGVYLDYCQRFLNPDQIDFVDIKLLMQKIKNQSSKII